MFTFALDMKASLTTLDVMKFNFGFGVNIHNGLIFPYKPIFSTKDISLEFDIAGKH